MESFVFETPLTFSSLRPTEISLSPREGTPALLYVRSLALVFFPRRGGGGATCQKVTSELCDFNENSIWSRRTAGSEDWADVSQVCVCVCVFEDHQTSSEKIKQLLMTPFHKDAISKRRFNQFVFCFSK